MGAAARGRWLLIVRVLAVTTVMVVAVQLVDAGYEYGFGEQMLLSLKGISWADPQALVNDWFNTNAPQPHVLFDVVTFVGEKTGLRPQIYFLYWLSSIVVAASAIVILSEKWLPRRARPFELLAGALLVTGPYFALGTFLLVHREAVPNGLGGAMGFLTAALLLARKDRAALIAAGVTTAVHVQHGSVVAVLLLVVWALDPARRRGAVKWFPLGVALILAATYTVAAVRGLVAGTGDISAVCETASPGHCDPDSWSWLVVRDGVVVVLLGAAAPLLARTRHWRDIAVLAAPALVALGALVTDLLDIEPFQSLGRQLFLYRFVMVVAPFAVMSIVLALTRPLSSDLSRSGRRRAWGWCVGGAAGFVVWHLLTFAVLGRFRTTTGGLRAAVVLIAVMIVIAIAGVLLLGRVRRVLAERAEPWLLAGLVVAVVAVLLGFGSRATGPTPLRIDYRPDDGAVALGHAIEDATPPGSVIVVRPDYAWFRLLTRRAVVVDCKGVPYGGTPWREYNERLAALGVEAPLACSNAGFAAMDLEDIEGVAARYGGTHVFLEPDDRAYAEAEEDWRRLTGAPGLGSLFVIP